MVSASLGEARRWARGRLGVQRGQVSAGTRRPDARVAPSGSRARRRAPGAFLSGVWPGVRRGWRLQFSSLFLHLLGRGGRRLCSFHMGLPLPPLISLLVTTRGSLSRPAHLIHSSLSGTPCTFLLPAAPSLSTNEPSFSHSKTYLVLPSPSSAALPASPGRTLFPAQPNPVFTSLLLGSAAVLLRPAEKRGLSQWPLPFRKHHQSRTPRLLGTDLFPSPPSTRFSAAAPCIPLPSTTPRRPPLRQLSSPPAPLASLCSRLDALPRLQSQVSPPPYWGNFKIHVVRFIKEP